MIFNNVSNRGRGVNPTEEIMKGVKFAQNFKLDNQREEQNSMLLKGMKKQIEDQRIDKVKGQANEALRVAEGGGGWDAYNARIGENSDILGGEKMRSTVDSDFKDGEGNLKPGISNRVYSETGTILDPSSKTLDEDLKKIFMINNKDGDKFGTFEALKAGHPNYRKYSLEEDAKEAKLKREIAGPAAKAEKTDDITMYNTLSELKKSGSLPDNMQGALDAYTEKVGLTKINAQDKIAGFQANPDHKEKMTTLADGGNMDDAYYAMLKKNEQRSGREYKNKPLDDQITTFSDLKQVKVDFDQAREDGTLNLGITNSTASEMAKITSKDSQLTPQEFKNQMLTIASKSKIGGALSRYVKAISGAAVTNEEFQRLMTQFIGGDINKVNGDTLDQALTSSMESLGSTIHEQVGNIDSSFPASKADRYRRMNKTKDVKGKNKLVEPKTTGKRDIKGEGLAAVREEVKTATEFGAEAVGAVGGGFLDSISSPQTKERKDLPWWEDGLNYGKDMIHWVTGGKYENKPQTTAIPADTDTERFSGMSQAGLMKELDSGNLDERETALAKREFTRQFYKNKKGE